MVCILLYFIIHSDSLAQMDFGGVEVYHLFYLEEFFMFITFIILIINKNTVVFFIPGINKVRPK